MPIGTFLHGRSRLPAVLVGCMVLLEKNGAPGRGWDQVERSGTMESIEELLAKKRDGKGERQSQQGELRPTGKSLNCRTGRWHFTHNKPETPKSSQLSESSDWTRKGLRPVISMDQNLRSPPTNSLHSTPLQFTPVHGGDHQCNWLSYSLVLKGRTGRDGWSPLHGPCMCPCHNGLDSPGNGHGSPGPSRGGRWRAHVQACTLPESSTSVSPHSSPTRIFIAPHS